MANSKINKLLFDVFLPQEDQVTALKKAKDLLHNHILSILNETFDQIPDDIYIDNLVIDLGAIDMQVLKENLTEHLRKHLKKNGDFPLEKIRDLSKLAENNVNHPTQNDRTSTDHLLFYLQHGYWHWNIQSEKESDVDHFLNNYFSDQYHVQLLISDLRLQSQNSITRFLILAFSNTFIKKAVLQALQGIHAMFDAFKSLLSATYEKQILKQNHFDYHLFYQLIASDKLNDLSDLKAITIKAIHENAIAKKWNEANVSQWEQGIQHSKNIDNIKKIMMKIQSSKEEKGITKAKPFDNKNDISGGSNEEKDATRTTTDNAFREKEGNENEKISITNSGLILFHVYLPFVFKELKWTDDAGKFVNTKKQIKAIHFLQFIITNKSRNQEHLLLLNKILCGWPVHLPITLQCNFTKKEKDIVTDLIDSLKEHWIVMKNTSAAGLIESFIDRKGIIQSSESGFLLQVELKTIDVLLDSLPFGFQTIKLPWNDYTIHTEWR